jgi:hypothetical protein
VKNLITFGAPHQGVFGVPSCEQLIGVFSPLLSPTLPCPGGEGWKELCELVRDILTAGAYDPWLQDVVAPAQALSPYSMIDFTILQYWHDTLNHTAYVAGSHFLAIVNNELEEKEPLYK